MAQETGGPNSDSCFGIARPLRSDSISVAWIERRLADVLQAEDLRRQALEADRKTAMRGHSQLEHLEMTLERRRRDAALFQRALEIVPPVQPQQNPTVVDLMTR